MDEKKKCKECFNCGYYSPYYTKGYNQFSKAHEGHCRQKRKTVGKHESCEIWASVKYRYNSFSKRAAEKALNEILDNLCEIRQIIEEQSENEDR